MVSSNREDEDRHMLDTSTSNSSLFLPSIKFTSATSHLSTQCLSPKRRRKSINLQQIASSRTHGECAGSTQLATRDDALPPAWPPLHAIQIATPRTQVHPSSSKPNSHPYNHCTAPPTLHLGRQSAPGQTQSAANRKHRLGQADGRF